MENVTVSVVMPCLNEAKTLPGCIEAARKGIADAGIEGEIIVVDNGSNDDSAAVAESFGARVVYCRARGYGNALKAGFAAARGDWIIMGDADQSYDFTDIPRFRDKMDAGYEFVIGNRFKGGIEKGAMPWSHRYIGNPALSALLRFLFGARVGDAHCGLRAFRRSVLGRMDLRTAGMEIASEMVIKAVQAGLRIAEAPVVLRRDARTRRPHLRTFHDGWRHLRYMLMMAPNWLFGVPGLICIVAGGGAILALMPGPIRIGRVSLDVHTMLLGMALALFGVYLVLLGGFVKVFTHTERLAPRGDRFTVMLRHLKLEHGLMFSAALVLVGLAGDIRFFIRWKEAGFGDLVVQTGMRWAILYTTILIAGLEMFFACFFFSMLGISRDEYIGDYTRCGE